MNPRSPADAARPAYPADRGDSAEQCRADAIARLGATDAVDPGIFLPTPLVAGGSSFARAWEAWLAEVFEAWLGDCFMEVHLAAGRMASERVAALDLEIDAALDPPSRRRSVAAARPFLEGRSQVQRQPQWTKYLRAHAEGTVPGHLPAALALQAALFHLPLLPALAAYVNLEGANGLAALPGGRRLDPGAFAERYPAGLASAGQVFRRRWTGAEPGNPPGLLACL